MSKHADPMSCEPYRVYTESDDWYMYTQHYISYPSPLCPQISGVATPPPNGQFSNKTQCTWLTVTGQTIYRYEFSPAQQQYPTPFRWLPPPSRKNSLTRGALLESLKQPAASAPRQFGRTSSGPSPHSQRVLQVSAAERIRLSLRVSIEYEYKLCTVLYVRNNCVYYMISMSEHFPPIGIGTSLCEFNQWGDHTHSAPHPRSFTPTLTSSSGTTV